MKKTQTKLSLHREVIRQLGDRDLTNVAGGTDRTDLCLMCPSRTWYTSRSRTVIH